MEVIVDIQCFNYGNNIFIKELAVVDMEGILIPKVYVFKPPCAWNQLPSYVARANNWLQRNFHGLDWDMGNRPYNYLHNAFTELKMIGGPSVEVHFYVKGLEKKRILEPYLGNVYNLEDIDCPSLHTPGFRQPEVCMYHRSGWQKNCALQNVIALRAWALREFEKLHNEGVDTVN